MNPATAYSHIPARPLRTPGTLPSQDRPLPRQPGPSACLGTQRSSSRLFTLHAYWISRCLKKGKGKK